MFKFAVGHLCPKLLHVIYARRLVTLLITVTM